ncbi:MAG: hypothetical protein AAB539_00205 [Patescibacteria group bacterium]
MKTYTMKCSCGDTMPVEAETRSDAVAKLQGMMTAEMIASHMAEKHQGEPLMSVADCHAMIERDLEPKE